MFTLADLDDFKAWIIANFPARPRRSAVLAFVDRAGERLVEARDILMTSSASGQLARPSPPARATIAQNAASDAAAVLEALGNEPPLETQELTDLASWSVSFIPAGARRTAYIQFLMQVGVLEHRTRTRFVGSSVLGQRARGGLVVADAISDANALLDALATLGAPIPPSGGEEPPGVEPAGL